MPSTRGIARASGWKTVIWVPHSAKLFERLQNVVRGLQHLIAFLRNRAHFLHGEAEGIGCQTADAVVGGSAVLLERGKLLLQLAAPLLRHIGEARMLLGVFHRICQRRYLGDDPCSVLLEFGDTFLLLGNGNGVKERATERARKDVGDGATERATERGSEAASDRATERLSKRPTERRASNNRGASPSERLHGADTTLNNNNNDDNDDNDNNSNKPGCEGVPTTEKGRAPFP